MVSKGSVDSTNPIRYDNGGIHLALAKNIIYYICDDRLPENEIQWRALLKSNAVVCLDDIVLV